MGSGVSRDDKVGPMETENSYEDEEASEDSRAKELWLQSRASIRKSLPSSQLHSSLMGTSLSLKMMSKKRAKNRVPGNLSTQRPTSADMDARLQLQICKRGLKADMDGDGDMDELDRLKQIEIVREMPAPLAWKRKTRDRLYKMLPDYKESGCSAWIYKRKVKTYLSKKKGRKNWKEFSQYFVLWRTALTKIEAHQGSGVLTYFSFLRWLFAVNMVIFLASFVFLVLPQVVFTTASYSPVVIGNTSSSVITTVETCSANYVTNITVQSDALNVVLNFIQGTGWMENTIMFYGFYVNKVLSITNDYAYNLPLAYTLTVLFYLLFSLILIVRKASTGFKERLFIDSVSQQHYSNLLFGTAWDYSVSEIATGELRYKSFYKNVIGELSEQARLIKIRSRTRMAKCRLYTIRFFTNSFIVGTLCGAGYLIYYTTVKTVELTGNTTWYDAQSTPLKFLIQYMTSLVITGLNAILPTVYKRIVLFEDFGTGMSVSITLLRTVFLKLASITIMLISVFNEITCANKDECRVGVGSCSSVFCWETKIGQEIYKLVIMDFFVLLGLTFAVELPRWLVSTRCSCKLVKRQEFDVAKEVLTLIYSETLLWLGAFYCPLIPAITVMKNLIRFYMKYLSTMVFYGPSSKPYSSSDSDAFFMYVLLCAYSLCVIPIGYCFWLIPPSRGCGPFRLYDKMYDIITILIDTWPKDIITLIAFLNSSIIEVTLVVVLIVAVYYLTKIIGAYKKMMLLLKEQLVVENYDKKFLLERMREMEANESPQAAQNDNKASDIDIGSSSTIKG